MYMSGFKLCALISVCCMLPGCPAQHVTTWDGLRVRMDLRPESENERERIVFQTSSKVSPAASPPTAWDKSNAQLRTEVVAAGKVLVANNHSSKKDC